MAAAIRLSQQHSCSLDHLVGGGEERWWDGEAEHPSRRNVDDELEPGRLHDRQIRRLRALENAACVDADVAIPIPQTCAEIGRASCRERGWMQAARLSV